MDAEVESILNKFANDTKLRCVAEFLQRWEAL